MKGVTGWEGRQEANCPAVSQWALYMVDTLKMALMER